METNKKMNILFKGSRLSGGAPRSALQYIKVLKADGHTVTVLIQEVDKGLKEKYVQVVNELVCRDNISKFLDSHKYIKAYKNIKQNIHFLKNKNPDFVIAGDFINTFFIKSYCAKNSIPLITLIAGGDLKTSEYALPHCRSDHFICFSKENKEVLRKFFDEDKITVISNRIEIVKRFDFAEHYKLDKNGTVNIFIASRLHNDKYDSVANLIDTVNFVAAASRKISLTIAGDGNRFDDLKKYAESIDNPNLDIELVGHIDNLVPYFEKAHIVVGKGRSVLEPIMMNRLGCVIGDDGKIEVCTTKNFDNLYHYNFSGRNLQKENPVDELTTLIDSLIDGTFDFTDFEETVRLIDFSYSSEYLPEKFHAVLDSIEPPKKTGKYVSPLLLVIKYIFLKIGRKLKRKG